MGQEEVLKVLKKAKKPLTTKEISELIDIGTRSVRRILRRFLDDCTINMKTRELSADEMIEKYGQVINSHRVQVYFLDGGCH